MELDTPYGSKIFQNKTKFEHQEQLDIMCSMSEGSMPNYVRPIFPLRKKYYTWKQLFDEVEYYRNEQHVDLNDFVFLLTNQYNEKNWFAFLGPSLRTGFIHTDDWPWFFGDGTDIRYPIAYEVTTWVLRGLMCQNQKEIVTRFHKKTVG